MKTFPESKIFIGAASFEERSIVMPKKFLENGGRIESMRLALLADQSPELQATLDSLHEIGVTQVSRYDRLKTRSLWDWAWGVASTAKGDIVIDATCLPREAIGMLLFALSLRREFLDRVRIFYVAAPSPEGGGYATLNTELNIDDRWLSKGIVTIRSIVGYPGNFSSEKPRHIIAFAGHEFERMLESIVYYEPDRLSLNNEAPLTSTTIPASECSGLIAEKLRLQIPLPSIGSVNFSACSIDATYDYLMEMQLNSDKENIGIIAMNSKLAFIGAALFCLRVRGVRMITAVPMLYNPLYCKGFGEIKEFDITHYIRSSRTVPTGSMLST